MLTRRALLGVAALAASPLYAVSASGLPAIAALDWVSGQNLLALGIPPVAMPELECYARLVVEPAAPPAVRELGLRSEPNLELVDRLKPELVLLPPELEPIRERVEPIAPTLVFDPDGFGRADLLGHAGQALGILASRLGRIAPFEEFVSAVEAELAEAGQRLRGYDGRPLYLATIIDGRRMLVFGQGSLFQAVLDRLGIENAWTGPTTRFGHVTLTVDRLSQRPEARLLCIGDSSRSSIAALLASPVVASLPFIRAGRIAQIPDVLFYGGLPPARRFARLAFLALAQSGG